MSDYQSTHELALEACDYASHLRAQDIAETRYLREAQRTADNGGFSPAESEEYRGEGYEDCWEYVE